MYAGLVDLVEGTPAVETFTPAFSSIPFVLSQFQSSTIPYMHTRVIDSAVDSVTLFAEFQTHTVGSTAEMGVAGYVAVSYVGVTATGLFGPDLSYQFLQVSSVANSTIPFTFGVPYLDAPFLLAGAASQSSDSVIVQWDSSNLTGGSVYLWGSMCNAAPSADVVNVDVLAVGSLSPTTTTTAPAIATTNPIVGMTTTSSAGKLQVTSFGVMSMMWMLAMLRV